MTPEERVELRVWIATEIMEWEEIDPKGCKKPDTFFVGKTGVVYYSGDLSSLDWPVWHPDTDLNQAFMVVEKMREMGWWLKLEHAKPEGWFAVFQSTGWKNGSPGEAYDGHPALAICLAAKAALSQE